MDAQELIHLARRARESAYCPYSGFAVGAALLTGSGKVYLGANVENASFGLSVCAERVAVFKAVIEGEREFTALAVVTDRGVSPCGACRQVIAEFGRETTVFVSDLEGNYQSFSAGELLPRSFGPADLHP